jgi:hypothetical protein
MLLLLQLQLLLLLLQPTVCLVTCELVSASKLCDFPFLVSFFNERDDKKNWLILVKAIYDLV